MVLGNTIFAQSSIRESCQHSATATLSWETRSLPTAAWESTWADRRRGVTPTTPATPTVSQLLANNGQNFPVLLEVLCTAVDSTIFGSLNSLAQTDFLIQFFANDAADPSGHGEGQTFLGETDRPHQLGRQRELLRRACRRCSRRGNR